MSKTAEAQGVYFEDLQKFGLPNFVYLDDKLVIVKSIICKKYSLHYIMKPFFQFQELKMRNLKKSFQTILLSRNEMIKSQIYLII
jgi:hypothetical protein